MVEHAWPNCRSCGVRLRKAWRSKRQRQKRIYCSVACIPDSVRAANGRMAREVGTIRARLAVYRGVLKRLRALERVTGEELLAILAEVGAGGYDAGYSACESKWLRRMQAQRKVA